MEIYSKQVEGFEQDFNRENKECEVNWLFFELLSVCVFLLRYWMSSKKNSWILLLWKRLGEELKNAKSNFESFEKKDVKLQEDIKHIKTKQKKLDKTIKQEKKTLEEKKSQQKMAAEDIERFQKEIDDLTKALQKEEKKLEKMNEKLKGKAMNETDTYLFVDRSNVWFISCSQSNIFWCFADETGPLHVELDKKQKEYLPWQKKIDDVQSKIDVCQSEYNMLSERSKTANNELTKAKENLENMAQTLLDRVC